MKASASGLIEVRQGCIMYPWLFNVYMEAEMKEVKMGMGKRGVRFQEYGGECRLLSLFYVDDVILCGQLKDLKAMVRCFVEVCRRGLKVHAGKSKVMAFDGNEGVEYEVAWTGYNWSMSQNLYIRDIFE